jgi:hypothetical protein
VRAVVIVRNSRLSLNPESAWGALSPLVDRPFLQHLVESIVGQGFRELNFILPEEDRVTTKMLGNGIRWGARFKYYPVAETVDVYDTLREIPWNNADERILLAHSDHLPQLRLSRATSATTLFCWREKELHWTGWGLIRRADALLLPGRVRDEDAMEFFLRSGIDVACLEVGRPLRARSYADLIESNRRVLSKEFTGLLLGGKEVQPGVWMARNVRVHPTARLAAPAFLGENCRIGAMVQVGPSASIGRDCMIERETHVANSVVYGGSYVGQQLALSGVVVDRSRLVSPTCGTEIEDVDELLLGGVFGIPLKTRALRVFKRVAALAALIVWMPFLAAMLLGSAFGVVPSLRKRMVVRTPAVSESYRWKMYPLWSFGEEATPTGRKGWLRHFFFSFLPALLSIAAGYMDLGGPRPRTREELDRLSAAKRSVYLRTRSGILQPLPARLSEADADVAVFENNGAGGREPRALIMGYVGRVLRSCLPGLPPFGQRRNTE